MITIKCKSKVAEQLLMNELKYNKNLEVSVAEVKVDLSDESLMEANTPVTEKYFSDLVKKVLTSAEMQKSFMAHSRKTYGKEWWSEWLGVSEKDIIKNIKEVFKSLYHP